MSRTQRKEKVISSRVNHLPPQLDDFTGLEWRLLDAADTQAFAALLHRIEQHDQIPYRTSLAEIEELLNCASMMRLLGGFINNTLRCYALVRIRRSEPDVALCQGGVDPVSRGRGLGAALVSWQTQQAQRLLAGCERHKRHIAFHVEDSNRELELHLRALGYTWTRTFYDLRAPVSNPPPEVKLDSFLTIVPWKNCEEEDILRVFNQIHADLTTGSLAVSLEQWLSGRTDFSPDWSFVALDHRADRPSIVGFIMASKYAQDWSVLGWREGTIDMLAVLPDYRGSSLAVALVGATMRAQARSGMEAVCAGLSSANHSQAIGVYDQLGFTTVGTTRLYELANW